MILKTCKDCICEPVCPKCFAYKDVLNVSDYCEHFKDKADVVEVKHGEWVAGHFEGGIFDGTNFEKCNVCQFERLFDDIRFKTTYKYCPNCGAKMDLKEGAEE